MGARQSIPAEALHAIDENACASPPATFVLVIVTLKSMTYQRIPRRVALSVPAAPFRELPLAALRAEILKQLKKSLSSDVHITSIASKMSFCGVQCPLERTLDYFMLPSASTDVACFTLQCFASEVALKLGPMNIMVSLNSKTIKIVARPVSTVENIKQLVQDRLGTPLDEQRLIFEGKELRDGCILDFYAIHQDYSNLQLLLKLRGGGTAVGTLTTKFADVSNSSALVKTAWSTSAPDWRIASPGLNVEGLCENLECRAHNKMVICQKGFTHYDLTLDTASCPMCSEQVIPLTCAFSNCKWNFTGTKLGKAGRPVAISGGSAWKEAGDCYERFGGGSSDEVHWARLLLIARNNKCAESYTFSENEECSICFEANVNHRAVATPCPSKSPHLFHKECIEAWLSRSSSCPLCCADISSMRC